MITNEDFFKGRDKTYAAQLTDAMKLQAVETLSKVNLLLGRFYAANPGAHTRGCNSGWRPPAVNAGVKGASPTSHHMTCKAVDVGDDDETLDKWCMTPAGQQALADIGLWMEHPSATPRWCHLQVVPPRSGKRVFYP